MLAEDIEGALSALFVGSEIALAVVLLASAGVFVRSFFNVYAADVGVNMANVLTMSLYVPPDRYITTEGRISFYRELRSQLQAVPGVESVAFGTGRTFDELDRGSSLPIVIVNQAFASRRWPGEDAPGKRLRLFGLPLPGSCDRSSLAVSPADPITLAGASSVSACALHSGVGGRRAAMRIDPVVALKHE